MEKRRILHLVLGPELPPELASLPPGDTVAFLAPRPVPPSGEGPSRKGGGRPPAPGTDPGEILDLVLSHDLVLTW